MGTEWQQEVFPKLKQGSTGQEMMELTDHFDKTGEWKWDIISNLAIRAGARSTMENSRSALAGNIMRKANGTNANMSELASAYKINKLGNVYNPWSDWHDEDKRKEIGPYSIGAYNLIPDYDESQTRGLDQHVRENKDDGSRYYTGATPTRKDIVPNTVWRALGLEKKEDN